MPKISCNHFPQCSGCQLIGEDDIFQKESKISQLSAFINSFSAPIPLKQIGWLSAGSAYLRDRLDFVFEEGAFGLYSTYDAAYGNTNLKKIINIEFCHQLSPALNDWFQEFRKILWPIKKGSIRLRVGPQGLRGAWLDFANLDIKALLEQKTILAKLLEMGAIIEMGQKRKILKLEPTGLKLKDPEAHVWFESRFQNHVVPLYCHIASFTQPSIKANHLILQQIEKWVEKASVASEFGAGIGNLSLTLLGSVDRLRIFESDALSLECLHQTLAQSSELQKQKPKIEFNIGDHQQKKNIDFESHETLLVNPPRSGLKGFLQTLATSPQKPKNLIYMSCSPSSWVEDGKALEGMGYQLKEAFVVDQFPQTKHYEILSQWLF